MSCSTPAEVLPRTPAGVPFFCSYLPFVCGFLERFLAAEVEPRLVGNVLGMENKPEADLADLAGLFGPASVTWRIHADPMFHVAGLRALFLQALHPVAMAGVARYSRGFRDELWQRLTSTSQFVATTTFGTTAEAEAAGARVREIHAALPGIDEPDLLRWVHCCEVDSFLSVARRSGVKISDDEADQYVFEQVRAAGLVGLDPASVPSDVDSLAGYFASVQPELALTPPAVDAAHRLLLPPMPAWVQTLTPARAAWAGAAALGFALLPGWARRLYRMPGLATTATTDRAATAAARAMRPALLALPSSVREGPTLRAARERLAG
jgi:uncharacterized protein (DUF2236 family)